MRRFTLFSAERCAAIRRELFPGLTSRTRYCDVCSTTLLKAKDERYSGYQSIYIDTGESNSVNHVFRTFNIELSHQSSLLF